MPRIAMSSMCGGRFDDHKSRGSFTCESAEINPILDAFAMVVSFLP